MPSIAHPRKRLKTNLTLPADVRVEARSIAVKRDLSLSQLVTQSLRAVIAAERDHINAEEASAA
jgi:hypothetical protein